MMCRIYSDAELATLLDFIEHELPINAAGWKSIHVRYSTWARNGRFPHRTLKGLQTKFNRVRISLSYYRLFLPIYCRSSLRNQESQLATRQIECALFLSKPRFKSITAPVIRTEQSIVTKSVTQMEADLFTGSQMRSQNQTTTTTRSCENKH
jgi:hypothetical protein